jgi:molybdopterin converting factor small subunit
MPDASPIKVHVPTMLRECCGGVSELPLSASSVRVVLCQLEERYPTLYRSICDETGAVRRHINVFVNKSHMRELEGISTELAPGDIVTIMTAVSGG